MKENLARAMSVKYDKFFTFEDDVAKELDQYASYFSGKSVLCPCGDWNSGFHRYFKNRFHSLKLSKLTAVSYSSTSDSCDVAIQTPDSMETLTLPFNGDFRHPLSQELLSQADVIATNPPFSLIREFISLLVSHDKEFVILAPQSVVSYKKVFPFIASNEFMLKFLSNILFAVPEDFENTNSHRYSVCHGIPTFSFGNVCWLDSLSCDFRFPPMFPLVKSYSASEYPRYDNKDAIEVSKVSDIPCDFSGVMGVPLTFFKYYNPEQFEIVGFRKGDDNKDVTLNGKPPFARVFIRNLHWREGKERGCFSACNIIDFNSALSGLRKPEKVRVSSQVEASPNGYQLPPDHPVFQPD